jgi:hypothetical protein
MGYCEHCNELLGSKKSGNFLTEITIIFLMTALSSLLVS